MTTREACGNSVRNITGCPYAGTSDNEDLRRHAVRRGADALLPAASARGDAAAQVQDRLRRLPRGSRGRLDQRHRLARAHRRRQRGFRVTVAGGTSILPVTGYVLYDFLPVEEMFNVAEAVVRVFHRFGDYEHPSAQPYEVRDQSAGLGRRSVQRYRGSARRIPRVRAVRRCRSIRSRPRHRSKRRTGCRRSLRRCRPSPRRRARP